MREAACPEQGCRRGRHSGKAQWRKREAAASPPASPFRRSAQASWLVYRWDDCERREGLSTRDERWLKLVASADSLQSATRPCTSFVSRPSKQRLAGFCGDCCLIAQIVGRLKGEVPASGHALPRIAGVPPRALEIGWTVVQVSEAWKPAGSSADLPRRR